MKDECTGCKHRAVCYHRLRGASVKTWCGGHERKYAEAIYKPLTCKASDPDCRLISSDELQHAIRRYLPIPPAEQAGDGVRPTVEELLGEMRILADALADHDKEIALMGDAFAALADFMHGEMGHDDAAEIIQKVCEPCKARAVAALDAGEGE